MKKVWKNIWPKLSKDVDTRKFIVDADEVVKLANEMLLDNINVQDIDELFQVTTDKSLSNDVLKETKHKCTKKLKFLKNVKNKRNFQWFFYKKVLPL